MGFHCYICSCKSVKLIEAKNMEDDMFICPQCGMEYTQSEFVGDKFNNRDFEKVRERARLQYHEDKKIDESLRLVCHRNALALLYRYYKEG